MDCIAPSFLFLDLYCSPNLIILNTTYNIRLNNKFILLSL